MTVQNNEKNEKPESLVLDLENLNTEYSNLLIQYEQAVANYTSLIQQQTTGTSETPLMVIPNNEFWGTEALSSSTIPSVPQCKALCATTSGCSGATYNTPTKLCSLRSGDGSLVPASSDSYALLPEETYLLLNMQSINNQLIEINQQILNKTTIGETIFDGEYSQRQIKAKELLQNYVMLNEERDKINSMISDFENLNQDEIDGNISINKNYYSFILLLILSVVLIVILYMFTGSSSTNSSTMPNLYQPNNQYGGKLGFNTYLIIFVFILIALVIKYFSNISSFIKSF